MGKYNAIQFYQNDGWRVTSAYGQKRGDVIHRGVDFGGPPIGYPVRTPWHGVVTDFGDYGSAGNTMVVRFEGTDYLGLFMHLDRFHGLRKGHVVKPKDVIGYNGMSGEAAGRHLHFELAIVDGNILGKRGPSTRYNKLYDPELLYFGYDEEPKEEEEWMLDKLIIVNSPVDNYVAEGLAKVERAPQVYRDYATDYKAKHAFLVGGPKEGLEEIAETWTVLSGANRYITASNVGEYLANRNK